MARSRLTRAKLISRPVAGAVVAAFIASTSPVALANPQSNQQLSGNFSGGAIAYADEVARNADSYLQSLVVTSSAFERRVNELEIQIGTVRENVNKAMVDLDRAREAAVAAREAVDVARTDLDRVRAEVREAQKRFGSIARMIARQGHSGSPSIKGADDIAEALDRAAAMRREAEKQKAVVDQLDRNRTEQANAESDLRSKKDAAEEAEAAAQQRQTDAENAYVEANQELESEQRAYEEAARQRATAQAALEAAREAVREVNENAEQYESDAQRKEAEDQAAREAAQQAREEQNAQARSQATDSGETEAAEPAGASEAENANDASSNATEDSSAIAQAEAAQVVNDAAAQFAESARDVASEAASEAARRAAEAAAERETESTGSGSASHSSTTTDSSSSGSSSADTGTDTTTNNSSTSADSSSDTTGSADVTGTTAATATPTNPEASSPTAGSRAAKIEAVVNRALSQVGTPYAWGGGTANGPSRGIRDGGVADSHGDYNKIGFDCSGLTLYAYAAVGIELPHYTGYQYQRGTHYPVSQMQRGDLLFWGPNGHGHVAIYLGDGTMVEAPQSGSTVRVVPVRYNGMAPNVVRLL